MATLAEGQPANVEASYKGTASWDIGEVVLTNPTGTWGCGSIPENQNITTACPTYYKNVAGMRDDFSATATAAMDEDTGSYDSHYLIGNFYQWVTATAGTGEVAFQENVKNGYEGYSDASKLTDATGSICPKGWKMPTSGKYLQPVEGPTSAWPYAREDSYYELMRAYGYPETGKNASPTVGWTLNNGTPYTAMNNGVRRVDYEPMYFAKAGSINSETGWLSSPAHFGYVWASTLDPSLEERTSVYQLFFEGNAAYPVGNSGGAHGKAVRCLAR